MPTLEVSLSHVSCRKLFIAKILLPIVILGISQISQVAREGWLAKVHSEQFHLPKVSEVGPGASCSLSMLLIAEREKHAQVNDTQNVLIYKKKTRKSKKNIKMSTTKSSRHYREPIGLIDRETNLKANISVCR